MEQEIVNKECRRCHQVKPLTEFSPKKKMKLGVHSFCKICINKKSKNYRNKNKTKKTTIPDFKFCNKCKQTLSKDNFTPYKATHDGLATACKKCAFKRHRTYVDKNQNRKTIVIPENQICACCKKNLPAKDFGQNRSRKSGLAAYCKSCFKQKMINYDRNAYRLRKYKTDPVYKIRDLLRGRIKDFLRRKNYGKKMFKTLDLLGCSAKECFEHLEKLFWPGMTRQNMGKEGWHIDHIIPLSNFNLTLPEEQKKAFHYTNLQPLWKEDNESKNNKLDWSPSKSRHPLPDRLKNLPTKDQNPPVEQQPPQSEESLPLSQS